MLYAEMAKNSSNAPRNFMFELALAARLARAGLKPQVQEPDISLKFRAVVGSKSR